jgi:hypothetical protein
MPTQTRKNKIKILKGYGSLFSKTKVHPIVNEAVRKEIRHLEEEERTRNVMAELDRHRPITPKIAFPKIQATRKYTRIKYIK